MSIDMKSEASAIPTGPSTIDKRGDRTDYSTQKIGERPREIVPGTEKPTRGERLQDWVERMKTDKMSRRQVIEKTAQAAIVARNVGLPGILTLSAFKPRARDVIRNILHWETPKLAQSPDTVATVAPENLDFPLMDPQALFESQGKADFSEIQNRGYSFRKLDKDGNLQPSDTPKIHLVKYNFQNGLNGNFELDDNMKSIKAVRYRRGEPTTQGEENSGTLVLETQVNPDEEFTAIPVKSHDEEYPREFWLRVGGEKINGTPVIHPIDPFNRRLPKAEIENPYLLYSGFVNDITNTIPNSK